MAEKIGLTGDATWLNSDSQILGRTQKAPHEQGVLLSIDIPSVGQYQAIVEKMNAASASQFCELVREEYREWKASKEAAQVRRSADGSDVSGDGIKTSHACEVLEEDLQTPEKRVQVDPLDPQSIALRIAQIHDKLINLYTEAQVLEIERDKLQRILEVLDAQPNDDEELSSVPTETPTEPRGSVGVDRDSRKAEDESD